MVVPNTSPVKSVKEFIDYAKSKKLSYASSGNGTSIHLCGELFKKLAGVDMQHVPYRGSAPALNDVLPGRLDVMFDNITSSLPHVRNNALRGLAVTTKNRVAVAPEFAPIADTVPGFDVSSWFSLFVPVKTPKEIVQKINRDVVTALGHGPTKEKFEQLGSAIVASTPEQMAAHLKSEMDKWGPVIREAGIKVEG
jgi:tripartite-type tricarboxylate transporter receptor subunit TctC